MNSYQDIIIAVHGIGDQSRNSTVRSVANRLAKSPALRRDHPFEPVAPQPLGYFHTQVHGAIQVFPLDRLDRFPDAGHPLATTGFCEVFWADIPQEVENEGRTLEEIKEWGRTVVFRAQAICNQAAAKQKDLPTPDFTLAAEVVDQVIDTIRVLENLLFIAEKAGMAKFDLQKVLRDYLGDVQIMTEFKLFRRDIIGRFHRALEQIHDEHPGARLHIVAHSEGTVVSFLGLLHAMHGERLLPATGESGARLVPGQPLPAWLKKVHGYMTFGSPIDKHLLLWPELFETFDCALAQAQLPAGSIHWRNYYDYGDPVGFELDSIRRWLFEEKKCFVFEFDGRKHDIGFARYLLPGKAHNDYWADGAVFEHFITDVIAPPGGTPPAPPAPRPLTGLISQCVPFALSAVVLIAGVLLLYTAVARYMNPPLDPGQNYVRFMSVGSFPASGASGWRLVGHALAVAALVAGTTLLARWPRLAGGRAWLGWGLLAFLAGCLIYALGVDVESRRAIGSVFAGLGELATTNKQTLDFLATAGTCLAAFLVACVGWTALARPKASQGVSSGRRTRWFRKGMRPLIASGAVLLALLIGHQMSHPKPALTGAEYDRMMRSFLGPNTNNAVAVPSVDATPTSDYLPIQWNTTNEFVQAATQKAEDVRLLVAVEPAVWPVVLAGAAFLYLWWLAALLFDLAFVWQRYVRGSVFLERLDHWRHPDQATKPRGAKRKPPAPAGPEPA